VWAAIAFVAACYMLGWLRLPHDAGGSIGPLRYSIGVATAAAGVFCLAAINGASLGKLNRFLPPAEYPGREVRHVADARLEQCTVDGGQRSVLPQRSVMMVSPRSTLSGVDVRDDQRHGRSRS
jgi:hypothetical protein